MLPGQLPAQFWVSLHAPWHPSKVVGCSLPAVFAVHVPPPPQAPCAPQTPPAPSQKAWVGHGTSFHAPPRFALHGLVGFAQLPPSVGRQSRVGLSLQLRHPPMQHLYG